MTQPTLLLEGQFDPKVKTYWLLQPTIVLALTIFLIPIIPIYLLIAYFVVDLRLKAISCNLTSRNLEISQGIFNKTESTIPLEKITDLQMFQGPIMRHFGLKGFRVETAGQSSSAGGHLVNMVGIVDTDGFRQAVLDQRDRLHDHAAPTSPPAGTTQPAGTDELLAVATEIREALNRIEHKLDKD